MSMFASSSGRLGPGGEEPGAIVLFFDGTCGLCNALVAFVLRHDAGKRIRFSPIQGELASRKLTSAQINNLESLYVLHGDVLFEKADAVLELCRQLGGFWHLGRIMRVVPRGLRHLAYDVVARNRYRWFGRKETCRLPSPEEESRFIP
jgi:predicted DCC family thiol-disulfide oxidoreductase YuxK